MDAMKDADLAFDTAPMGRGSGKPKDIKDSNDSPARSKIGRIKDPKAWSWSWNWCWS